MRINGKTVQALVGQPRFVWMCRTHGPGPMLTPPLRCPLSGNYRCSRRRRASAGCLLRSGGCRWCSSAAEAAPRKIFHFHQRLTGMLMVLIIGGFGDAKSYGGFPDPRRHAARHLLLHWRTGRCHADRQCAVGPSPWNGRVRQLRTSGKSGLTVLTHPVRYGVPTALDSPCTGQHAERRLPWPAAVRHSALLPGDLRHRPYRAAPRRARAGRALHGWRRNTRESKDRALSRLLQPACLKRQQEKGRRGEIRDFWRWNLTVGLGGWRPPTGRDEGSRNHKHRGSLDGL